MMIVFIQLYEKVFKKELIKEFTILLYLIANIRSILGISNINESTEVKADRYPQYEVYKSLFFIHNFHYFTIDLYRFSIPK